ncbi:Bug family tripartite tricarboxylate transporter substrate binding protein [Glaciimonas immobilis]|uniref:Tripartite-type tricarboxylate transporter receptor subunit TctC n=1 Tax=Glaciimonas immobilis TaxID=728004 RepID=A0A840RW17_9BURK|nr:tripartite tricarboxylate transporter substrate binding protein [Glaciimonas immobilis]KAF3996565.1 tripartite tricarboxylate transporter substrate binding protein [Glaciimonas immobilis]MBB5201066.1 tripartite-type tricarboxylate transporter receptor subunit TctC [Glaciimonas immobilis]
MYSWIISRTNRQTKLGKVLCLALSLASVAIAAHASPYPNQTIKIIVPYSPGTGSDVMARTIGQSISRKSHVSVIVENRDGGGGVIGSLAALQAAPDGYTVLIVANPFVIAPVQKSTPPYDPIKDFVPIAKVVTIPLVLALSPTLPINNIKELVAYAKANPGKLTYASSGPGTISQQEMEIFKQVTGVDIVEVPYKSTSQAMTDLLGGHIALFPVVVPLVQQYLRAGKIRGLAVFDTHRSALFPDIPPIAEGLGIPGYLPSPVWYGFVAPAATPRDVVATLSDLINDAMQNPEVKERLVAMGAQAINPTNAQFSADLKMEAEKAKQLTKKIGTAK